jgi:hydroxymethylpyrimidine/phosphomethylpyrimidine kinase
MPKAVALTIAGSDPSGGAGLQADLKTFQQLKVYGMSVVTLVTVQNTRGVSRVETLPPDLVVAQLEAVLEDIPPVAIKTGALGSAELVRSVAKVLGQVRCPIVVDPVLVSKHGDSLAGPEILAAYRESLLPLATVATPNRVEAELLTGIKLDKPQAYERVLQQFQDWGTKYPLLKLGQRQDMMQVLLGKEDHYLAFELPVIKNNNTHGSGCVLSAAITAYMTGHDHPIEEVIELAMQSTHEAIQINTKLGHGIHPVEVRGITPPD